LSFVANATYQAVSRQRLYEQVAAQIEQMIIDGTIAVGEPLPPEKELIEQFQVGRITIREALLSLQQKGMIRISNGERTRVTRPNLEAMLGALGGAAQIYLNDELGVRDFQGLRSFIEIAMVRVAATSATPEDVKRIHQALLLNKAAQGDREAFGRTDFEFHLAIARVSGNNLLLGAYRALSGWLLEQRSRTISVPGAESGAYKAHECIYEAIQNRDPDLAERHMRDHLNYVTKAYWQSATPSEVKTVS
jgi:GntR family transcriptional repressor for pyruvate dehydrogenase complex